MSRKSPKGSFKLPSFCKPIFDDRSSSIIGIDFWTIEPSRDDAGEKERGEAYADEAIEYARRIGQTAFIDCIIMYMAQSLHSLGAVEKAFIARAMRDEPHCIDRIFAVYRHLAH